MLTWPIKDPNHSPSSFVIIGSNLVFLHLLSSAAIWVELLLLRSTFLLDLYGLAGLLSSLACCVLVMVACQVKGEGYSAEKNRWGAPAKWDLSVKVAAMQSVSWVLVVSAAVL